MPRQINVRFLLLTLLTVLLVCVCGQLLHNRQIERNAGYLYARGQQSIAKKEYAAAQRYLAQYLSFRPDDAAARARHGVIQVVRAKTRREKEQAYLTLDRALRDQPDLEKQFQNDLDVQQLQSGQDKELVAFADALLHVRLQAINLAMDRDLLQLTDAKYHIDALIQQSPGDAGALVLLGRCEESSGRRVQAEDAYRRAIAAEPSRIEAYVRLASLYRRTGRENEGNEQMNALVERNQQSVRARLATASYYRIYGNLAQAKAHLASNALKEVRDDKDVLLAEADIALAEENHAVAREKLARGLKAHPHEPQFQLVLAGLELRVGKRPEAVALLKQAVKEATNQSEALWSAVDLLIDAEDIAESRPLIARLRKEQFESAAVDFLEARMLLQEGNLIEAEGMLLRCADWFGQNPELALRTQLALSGCYQRLGKPDESLKAAQRALGINRSSMQAQLSQAAALYSIGNVQEALSNYQSLVSQYPSARLIVARIVANENIKRPVAERSFASAHEALDGAPAALKATLDYQLVRAQLLAAEGTPEKRQAAQKLVEAAKMQYPKDPRVWGFLAEIASVTSIPEADAVLDLAFAQAGDHASLRMTRLSLLVRAAGQSTKKLDAASVRTIESGIEKFADPERSQLERRLAEAYAIAISPADAERLLRQVSQRNPKDLAALTRLLEFHTPRGDLDTIKRLRDDLMKVEGEANGSVWRYADAILAWLQYHDSAKPSDIRHAKIRLAEAIQRRPNWIRAVVFDAEIEDREGNPESAIEKYLKAIRLGADEPVLISRVSYLLTSRGRHDEVRRLIDGVRSRVSETNPELQRLDVINLVKLGENSDRILKELEAKVRADSKDPRDHLFRGHLFASMDRAGEAEASYRKSIELNPTASEGWASLIVYLCRSDASADPKQKELHAGRVKRAREEIERLRKSIPAEKLPSTLAICYEAVGDREEAEKNYLQAVREAGSDPSQLRPLATFYIAGGELQKAEAVLRQLSANSTTSSSMRRWARRSLALTLAVGADYRRTGLAIEELDRNLTEQPGSSEDLRARALLLATRPGNRGQSIKDLEAAFLQNRPEPAEEFLLANLYEGEGDWRKANERYLGLLARRGGDNPAYIARYIRSLLAHDDLTAAASWLSRLEEKTKRGAVLVELQARVAAKRGDKAKAASLLAAFSEEEFKLTKDPAILRQAGLLLAELKLIADAEAMLKRYVSTAESTTPVAVLVMADFLARHQNRVSDALSVCSSALAKVNPEIVARMTVAVVRLGEASGDDFLRAETVISSARQAKPESIDIAISLADLRDAQGRYDDAKRMYREILKIAPNSDLAMNNLAWLLTLHESNRVESLELINRAITLRGPTGNLLDTRGIIHLMTGTPDDAIADLGKALSQETLPERHFHLAQAYQKQGKPIEATRAMRKARDMGLTKKDLHKLEWQSYDSLSESTGTR